MQFIKDGTAVWTVSVYFRASILFPFSQFYFLIDSPYEHQFPFSPFLKPGGLCLCLCPPFSPRWFDFPHSQLLSKTGRGAPLPPPPPPFCQFDNSLSQVFNVSSEGAPLRASVLPVGGRKMTITFAAEQRGMCEEGRRLRKRIHLAFDWTLIVICGAHCRPVKGSSSNGWSN